MESGQDSIPPSDKKFVPVMITPYTRDMKIDYTALSKLIDFYLACGVKGFFANCASSEMYHLDNAERLALTRHVVKQVNGAVPVVATGSFGDTMESRADFTKEIYHTGIDAVILITSHFASKDESDTVMIDNLDKFLTLTDNIPLGTYECPSPYKRILTPTVFQFMLDTKRFVYHKDTTLETDKIKVKLDMAQNTRLEFYDAHTPNTVFSLQHGAKGMSAIAGNFYPDVFAWMCAHVNDPGRKADVAWLQSELTRADAIVGNGYNLSAKYFLNKRGVPMEVLSRSSKGALTQAQMQSLDALYKSLQAWHERLGLRI